MLAAAELPQWLGPILWVAIVGVFLFFWIGGKKNKKNYKGQSMEITKDWYEQSQIRYGSDTSKKAYFFDYDKNYLTQGHRMVDRDHNMICEAKILYGDPVSGYELDLINHVIDYKSHHKIGAVTTLGAGADGMGMDISSYFKFDGINIWEYLESLGYSYHFKKGKLLAYQFDIMKDGAQVGTVYSSNNGKNYFGCEGPIEAKTGGKGLLVVECADRDMDALFLYAVAFARTEFSAENMR